VQSVVVLAVELVKSRVVLEFHVQFRELVHCVFEVLRGALYQDIHPERGLCDFFLEFLRFLDVDALSLAFQFRLKNRAFREIQIYLHRLLPVSSVLHPNGVR